MLRTWEILHASGPHQIEVGIPQYVRTREIPNLDPSLRLFRFAEDASLSRPPRLLAGFSATFHVGERLDVERSYHVFERLTSVTTNSITGTSISTPTTVASVAPD